MILAFDTCFGNCSVAVFRDVADAASDRRAEPVLLAAIDEPMTVGHAERLLPMIAEVMSQAGVRFTDLDAIAVTVGPGTFTGVRTGIAAARALALATGLPVLAVTSLGLIAAGAARRSDAAAGKRRIAVCMEAGKGQLYAQEFEVAKSSPAGSDFPAGVSALGDAMLTTTDLLAGSIIGSKPGAEPNEPSSTMVVGTAAAPTAAAVDRIALSRPSAREPLPRVDLHAEIACSQPSARDMRYVSLQAVAPVQPLYLRQPDAIPSADTAFARAPS